MSRPIGEEAREDLTARGYSRRQLAGIAAVFGVGAIAATSGRPSWAAIEMPAPTPNAKVRIDKNECWTGPMKVGQAAAVAMVAQGNRYFPNDARNDLLHAVSAVEGIPADHVSPWPGSSDALCRAVVTFCSPKRGLVTADPVFELAGATADWLGAPVKRVPLTPDYRHDVKAMLAADPNAGAYYICSPNNPTGTLTPIEDIDWLVANKPDGAFVIVDEAYIHFADVPSASRLVTEGKDVVVLRTFSKVFGMAGLRMGYMMARPEVIRTMQRYDGGMTSGALCVTTLACAVASLTARDEIAARKAQLRETRAMTVEHVKKRGLSVVPSEANMIMIDWKTKSAGDMRDAFRAQGVEIGRVFPAWPTHSRVSIGSMDDMKAFCATLDRIWV
ncbi:MAG TPA: aminotransferase class I/II-fold pyridoxal phosphate-dependent enzyme [Caulobacteraceae bacterium]|jgi:histidinol-phosphate aminotransferase|nr:aminotransferase class I/II-fold pyridoxal phosphate-dependent enzyme [Caulobacteraceae bacterium]